MSTNRNSYYKLDTTYKSSPCSDYQTFKSQEKCPMQVKENYGAFSLRGALRPPYGCGQYYCSDCGCNSSCGKCNNGEGSIQYNGANAGIN